MPRRRRHGLVASAITAAARLSTAAASHCAAANRARPAAASLRLADRLGVAAIRPSARSLSLVVPALPSSTASASCCTISSIERMLSSLPGIGRSTTSGSQSVSISATVVMPSFWASLDGVVFLLRIDDDQALRQPVHRAHAVAGCGTSCDIRASAPTASSSSTCPTARRLRSFSSSSKPRQPVANRAEVGERAAQPAIADVRHAAALRFALDRSRPLAAWCRRTAPGCRRRRPASGTSWLAAGRESFRGRR